MYITSTMAITQQKFLLTTYTGKTAPRYGTMYCIVIRECGSTLYVGMPHKTKWPPHTLHCKVIIPEYSNW